MDVHSLQQSNATITPPFRRKISHGLIDAAASIIESIWPSHSICKTIILTPLKPFLVQTLRESKVSIVTLQIALLYLLRIKIAGNYESKGGSFNFAKCGRRMFIAALMVAGKFLLDKYPKNCIWARLTKTPLAEMNSVELAFLRLIDYNLFVPVAAFFRWSTLLSNYICTTESRPPLIASCGELFSHLSKSVRKVNRYSPYTGTSSHSRRSTHSKPVSVDSHSTPDKYSLHTVTTTPVTDVPSMDSRSFWNSIQIKNTEAPNKQPSDLFQSSPQGLQPMSPVSNTNSPEGPVIP
ncbi:PHO85 cyclin-5 [Basidiobolus ranarum]|uniref:PHO85 cyclin-5 n=1 Tax=Basidiobolus ranarum TaxID=34480 RepID=A0ABR2WXX8_9FUNG